jgi:RNA polymerase sigma-70 factor (ECF subfamily)
VTRRSTSQATDAEFQQLTELYRPQLLAHCYKMLGSFHDAEDAVQETFLRAWRGFERFEGRGAIRNWLYRIATNVCLNVIARRRRHAGLLPEDLGPPSDEMPHGRPATEVGWLEPFPDAVFDLAADGAPGPEARYEAKESISLAFVAVIQHLPPRQRAILLLRDALGWRAAETAEALNLSVSSVNSSLHRARRVVKARLPAARPDAATTGNGGQRRLLDRYLLAWEHADVDALVELLTEDAILNMPPWRQWYRGRRAIAIFLAWAWRANGGRAGRLLPIAANGQPAFAHYLAPTGSADQWRPHAIWVPGTSRDAITGVTGFVDVRLFEVFRLPRLLTAPVEATRPPPAAACRS